MRHDLALSGFNLGWCPGGPHGGHSAVPLTARAFWPTMACLFYDSQGGCCVGRGTGRPLHTEGRIRRSWKLRGLVGKCPNLSMALAKPTLPNAGLTV